jgi:hypothetical protein
MLKEGNFPVTGEILRIDAWKVKNDRTGESVESYEKMGQGVVPLSHLNKLRLLLFGYQEFVVQ